MERPLPEVSLYLGALKQSAWDTVLKHATELGVSRIVRVESVHAVSRLEGKAERKAARWRDLLIEACKQSANPWLPELVLMPSVEQACSDEAHPGKGWVAQLGGETVTPGQALGGGLPEVMALWVGPEGDFSESELEQIRKKGMTPITLGPRVLRAETAVLSLLSRLQLNG
jgi:16S rRNA (uracil1498-N3)-methyltransferase